MINLNPCNPQVAFGIGQNKKAGSCNCGCSNYESLTSQAIDLKLPYTASRKDIEKAIDAEKRASIAIDLKLPYTASWKDIEKAIDAEKRASIAIDLGLPYTASWKDIKKAIKARQSSGLWFA